MLLVTGKKWKKCVSFDDCSISATFLSYVPKLVLRLCPVPRIRITGLFVTMKLTEGDRFTMVFTNEVPKILAMKMAARLNAIVIIA